MEIPAVQKFNWGWQQGIKYANENLGTNIEMHPEDFVYQGTFSDIAAGQQIAASMFDRGVTCIHAAAGGVGVITKQKHVVRLEKTYGLSALTSISITKDYSPTENRSS